MAPFSAFWDGTKKWSLGHHRSTFVGKNTLTLLETRPQSSWMRSFETFDIVLSWEVSFGATAIEAPFSAFRDGTKKRSLGHHCSTFVCKKPLTLLETRPPNSCMWTFETFDTVLSWVVSSGAKTSVAPYSTFWDETKIWNLRNHRPTFVRKKALQLLETRPPSSWMWSFETFDTVLSWVVSFGVTTLVAPFSMFWDETKKRSLGITVLAKKPLTFLETRPQSSWMWSFETFDIVLRWVVSFGVIALVAPFSAFWNQTKIWNLGHHRSTVVRKKTLQLLDTRPPNSWMWNFETFDIVLSWVVSFGATALVAPFSTFWDRTKKRSLGNTVWFFWQKNL